MDRQYYTSTSNMLIWLDDEGGRVNHNNQAMPRLGWIDCTCTDAEDKKKLADSSYSPSAMLSMLYISINVCIYSRHTYMYI